MAVEAEALEAPEPPEWEDWKAAHARRYATAQEEEARRQTYNAEADKTRRHNLRYRQGLETYTVAVNGWSDLTHGSDDDLLVRLLAACWLEA